MPTMRPLNEDGSWEAKYITVDCKKVPTVDRNDRSKAEVWRKTSAMPSTRKWSVTGALKDWAKVEREKPPQIP
jgi:hypothetical protein